MTLVFGLLRDDHIIFASDRRHVTGTVDESYINDHGWKTEKILGNTAMLGFAGHDFVEQIVAPLKRKGALEGDSLQEIADSVSREAERKYSQLIKSSDSPSPQIYFLLAGFRKEAGEALATIYKIQPGSFYPYETCYDADSRRGNFEVIGKLNHGALYALHKCEAEAKTVEAGIQLAYFTLTEVTRYERSVGGPPEICVLRPDREIEDRSNSLEGYATWARDVSEKLHASIITPARPSRRASTNKKNTNRK
jgi:20S proteasome alpha/beta subunit